jgi:hypothetical protein
MAKVAAVHTQWRNLLKAHTYSGVDVLFRPYATSEVLTAVMFQVEVFLVVTPCCAVVGY